MMFNNERPARVQVLLLLWTSIALGLGAFATGCGSDCGEGTVERDGTCVRAEPPCQSGTHVQDGVCVPDVLCGDGTYPEAGECLPDVECGEGTHAEGGECQPDVECGEGTHAEGDACVPDELLCGEGTRLEGDLCVWDDGIAVETPWERDIVVVPDSTGYRAEVSLDVDSEGNSYAAWIDFDTNTGMTWLKVAVLPDNGTAFGPALVIDAEPTVPRSDFFQGDPTVVVDASDRVYIGFCNYFDDGSAEVVVSTSDDHGASFSESVRASTGRTGNFNDRPWLSVSPVTGDVFVTYLAIESDYSYLERISISEDGGESWDAFDEFSIYDRFGNYMIAYYAPLVPTLDGTLLIPGTVSGAEGETELFIASRSAEGTERFAIDRLDVPIYGSRDITWGVRPILAETSDGTLYLAYIDAPDSVMGVYLTRSLDGGETFSAPMRMSGPQLSNQTMLWMDLDDLDEAHLIWIDNREGLWRVLHRYTTGSGDAMSPLYAVSDETFSGSTGGADHWLGDFIGLSARNGRVHAAWTDSREGFSDIYFSRADLGD